MKSAAEMVILLREAQETNIGVYQIAFGDGRSMTLDRKQLLAELKYYTQKAAREAGRPSCIPVEFV